MLYRMSAADWALVATMTVLLALTVTALCLGQANATFVPVMELSPMNWGLVSYTCYLLIPTALHIKEAIQWHISRSRI